MAYRVKEQTARKSPGKCDKCGKEIQPGERYRKATAMHRPKMVRCGSCPPWSRADLETGKLAPVYKAQDEATDALAAFNFTDYPERPSEFLADVASVLTACAEEATSAKEDLEEGYNNLPEGLQNSSTGEGIQEKVDILDAWISELESWEFSGEENPEEVGDFLEWAGTVIEEAQGVIDGLEL